MSKENDRVLGHADESDGIEEYDNPLPDWWLGLLWFTIIWAVAYSVHYHFIADRSQEGRLAREMQAAEARWPAEAGSAAFAITPAAVEAGEAIYMQNCVPCHGAEMQGGIGVALNDDEWVHGSDPETVVRIITEGVTEKGMLAWGPILGPEKVNQVAAYVLHRNEELVGASSDDDDDEPHEAEHEDEDGEEG